MGNGAGTRSTLARMAASRYAKAVSIRPSESYLSRVRAVFTRGAERAGLSPDEQATLQREGTAALRSMLGPSSHIYVAVTDDALNGILDSGRLKSQFETGKSGAFLGLKDRAAAEHEMFGLPSDPSAHAAQRPIYGYVSPDETGRHGGAIANYGTISIRLNDSVKGRTTVTYGDSFGYNPGAQAVPSPYNRASYLSVPWGDRHYDAAGVGWGARGPRGVNYVEAQIHRGVSVRDIAGVSFAFMPSTALTDRLDSLGIPWQVTGL